MFFLLLKLARKYLLFELYYAILYQEKADYVVENGGGLWHSLIIWKRHYQRTILLNSKTKKMTDIRNKQFGSDEKVNHNYYPIRKQRCAMYQKI